ncbi:MAG: hypothetical protein M9927_25510 [Anaerolineae bacterium]|nr:hypothetical protein [Anaerolineae bacterium]
MGEYSLITTPPPPSTDPPPPPPPRHGQGKGIGAVVVQPGRGAQLGRLDRRQLVGRLWIPHHARLILDRRQQAVELRFPLHIREMSTFIDDVPGRLRKWCTGLFA